MFFQSIWYDLETGIREASGPVSKVVDAPLEKIPVFVRGGKIIPFQEPEVTTDKRLVFKKK